MAIHHGGRGPGHLSRMSTSALSAIAEIYRTGSQGFWLDLQGTPGLYTDTAGTTAATWGDSVALALDHSRQMSFDARTNLLTYSEDFSNAAWTKAQATVTANSTVAPDGTSTADTLSDTAVSNIHYTYQASASTLSAGATVVMSVYAKASTLNYVTVGISDISVGTSYAVAVFNLASGTVATSAASGSGYAVNSPTITAIGDGWYRCSVVCTLGSSVTFARAAIGVNKTGIISGGAGGMESYLGNGSGIFVWGAQLEASATATTYQATTTLPTSWLGNHATQATSSKRPILGRHPRGGRRNLLTYTEDFSNAAWQKSTGGVASAPSITADFGTSPDGTNNADRAQFALNGGTASADRSLLSQSVTIVTATSYTFSIWLRSLSGTVAMGIGCDGVVGNTPITVTSTWQRFTLTGTSTGTSGLAWLQLRGGQTPTQANAADVLVYGAQLETGSTATAYQKVVSTYDCTEAGVPDCRYLYAVTDDALATPAIDFTGTDKMTVFAGVRKLSDAARAVLLELGNAPGANTIRFETPDGGLIQYAWATGGTTVVTAVHNPYVAPISNILTGLGDISGDSAILRVNGVQRAVTTTDQGTGNYGNYALYLFSRGGTSLPFNGFCYDLAVVGKLATSGEIAACEAQMNTAMGIY